MTNKVTAKQIIEGKGSMDPIAVTPGLRQRLEGEVTRIVTEEAQKEFDRLVEQESSKALERVKVVRPEDIPTKPIRFEKVLEGILKGTSPEEAYWGKGSVHQAYENLGVSPREVGYDFTWEIARGLDLGGNVIHSITRECAGSLYRVIQGGGKARGSSDGVYRIAYPSINPHAICSSPDWFEVLVPIMFGTSNGRARINDFPEFLKMDSRIEGLGQWVERLKKTGYKFPLKHLNFSPNPETTRTNPFGVVDEPNYWSHQNIPNFPEGLSTTARGFRRGAIYFYPEETLSPARNQTKNPKGLLMYIGKVPSGYSCFIGLSRYSDQEPYRAVLKDFEGGIHGDINEVIRPELKVQKRKRNVK
ncbi:MAG: hypothetical protein ABIB47_05770 [Candidatus Woesearchaeota archaeon]